MKPLAYYSYLLRPGHISATLLLGGRSSLTTNSAACSQLSRRASTTPPHTLRFLPFARQQHRLISSGYSQPTAAQELAEELQFYNHRKWGWVIYRCTYGDDEAWERFKVLVTRYSRRDLQDKDVPQIVADGIDWTFVSDPTTLDGASRNALRKRFQSWVADAEPAEQSGLIPSRLAQHNLKSSRYTYFVQVDEASLRSVVDADPADDLDPGWVNLVRCAEGLDDNLSPEGQIAQEEYKRELAKEGEEYISENWIMLAASSMSVDFYASLNSISESWYMHYSQPPNLVVY